MHRTFAENQDLTQPHIAIRDENEIHHIKSVLRMKAGASLVVFNGKGEEADAAIVSISKKELCLKISAIRQRPQESTTPYLILACAIPKKEKFEWIIEKAVELGVMEIVPVKTTRTESRLTPQQRQKKHARFKTVAVNAAKQCQRLTVPTIHDIMEFPQIFPLFPNDCRIVLPCLIPNRYPIAALPAPEHAVKTAILIGPEGDFTEEEIALALKHDALPVSLGDTVLKVETAAISTVAFFRLIQEKVEGHA